MEDCCLCQLEYLKILMEAHLVHLPARVGCLFRKAFLLRESPLLFRGVTAEWEQTVH